MKRPRGLLLALALGASGCAAPPFGDEGRMFPGYAPDSVSARRIHRWKSLEARDEAALIPWSASARFPSRKEGAERSSRKTEGSRHR